MSTEFNIDEEVWVIPPMKLPIKAIVKSIEIRKDIYNKRTLVEYKLSFLGDNRITMRESLIGKTKEALKKKLFI